MSTRIYRRSTSDKIGRAEISLEEIIMSKINRRTFAGAIAAGSFATAATTSAPSGGSAVAETNSGKIRGVLHDRVYGFRGVPYGASTQGQNRFMPPVKPQPWSGVRDAFNLGQK